MKNKLALFYMNSCKPCQYQKPLVEKIAKKYKLFLEMIETENKEGFKFAEHYEILGFPSLVLIKDDIIINQINGYDFESSEEVNEKKIVDALKEFNFIK
jgi:thiol-disulfide isomerase/thioredoxin